MTSSAMDDAPMSVDAMRRRIVAPGKLGDHFELQASPDADLYESCLLTLLHRGVDVPASARTAALAAALSRPDAPLCAALLALRSHFDVPIVLRALELLDAPRHLRRAEAKLAAATAAQAARVARLAETAGIAPAGAGRTDREVLREIDTRLGTGVRKIAKRMRTVQSLRALSAGARTGARAKSRRLNAEKLRAELRAAGDDGLDCLDSDGGASTPDAAAADAAAAAQGVQELTLEDSTMVCDGARARQRTLAGAVKRAHVAHNALTAQRQAVATVRSSLADAGVAEGFHVAVSGACARRIRRWLAAIPRETLESYLVMDQPRDAWRRVFDIVHAAPADFALPSFAAWVFAESDDALARIDCDAVRRYRRVTAALASEQAAAGALAEGVPVDWSLLRRRLPRYAPTGAALRRMLDGPGATLKQLLWYYADGLEGVEVLADMARRLAAGEAPGLGVGKLLERMLTLQKRVASGAEAGEAAAVAGDVIERLGAAAAAALERVRLQLPEPVLVLGDASHSMEICIETSAIVACMLAALSRADVLTFAGDSQPLPTPSGVRDALRLAQDVRTRGCTCPAASMQAAYETRKRYASILVITDEEENTKWPVPLTGGAVRRMNFAGVLERYRRDVSPGVRVTFVSFLANMDRPGAMTPALVRRGFEVQAFRMARQPDLRRLDGIFASMGAGEAGFAEEVAARREAAAARRAEHAIAAAS